jgi:hypothetical protein
MNPASLIAITEELREASSESTVSGQVWRRPPLNHYTDRAQNNIEEALATANKAAEEEHERWMAAQKKYGDALAVAIDDMTPEARRAVNNRRVDAFDLGLDVVNKEAYKYIKANLPTVQVEVGVHVEKPHNPTEDPTDVMYVPKTLAELIKLVD